MASRRRDDNRPIARRAPSREPKHRILIVCEGRITEPEYFRAFQLAVRNPRVHIEVAEGAGVPKTLVEAAIRLRREAEREAKRQRDESLLWDEVWAVFDVDDHPNLDQAKNLARRELIELAVSNPCFELWALLHYEDQRAHIDRKKLRAKLKRHQPRYDKSLDFAHMHPGYDDALERARALDVDAARHGESERNPTTGVHRLTEVIRHR